MATVVVGARGSRLAQAMVAEYLARLSGPCPVVKFKNRVVMTDGDRNRTSTLREVSNGIGAFSNQLEQELLEGRIDVAVHSLKDLPTAMPEGLVLAVTPPREDIRDALCGSTLAGLRRGARVGTGSPRRVAQLKALRPDLAIVPIRGNVGPRLARVKKTGLDAVVLAAAGLRRLGLQDSITELLPLDDFAPSPGQGALGIQLRAADTELVEMLNCYGDPAADAAVRAERALLAELHGGCSVPVGAYAMPFAAGLKLTAQVTSLDGAQRVFASATGADARLLGETLARTMLEQGAEAILRQVRATV